MQRAGCSGPNAARRVRGIRLTADAPPRLDWPHAPFSDSLSLSGRSLLRAIRGSAHPDRDRGRGAFDLGEVVPRQLDIRDFGDADDPNGATGLREHRRSPPVRCKKLLRQPGQWTRGSPAGQIEVSGAAFVPICMKAHGSSPPSAGLGTSFNRLLPGKFLGELYRRRHFSCAQAHRNRPAKPQPPRAVNDMP